jgi:hypothetical protein
MAQALGTRLQERASLSRPELNLHLEAIAGSELVLVDTWGHIIWLGEPAEPGVSRRS